MIGGACVRDSYIGVASVKVLGNNCVRNTLVKDVGAIKDTCFRDAPAIRDIRTTYIGAVRDTCFRDPGVVNYLEIYLQSSQILELKQYSPALKAGVEAS